MNLPTGGVNGSGCLASKTNAAIAARLAIPVATHGSHESFRFSGVASGEVGDIEIRPTEERCVHSVGQS